MVEGVFQCSRGGDNLTSKHRFPRCPSCLEQVVPNSRGCPSCGVAFGSPLEAGENAARDPGLLKPNDWTRISLGLSPRWRAIGSVVSIAFAVFVTCGFAFYLTTPDPTDTFVFFSSAGGLGSAYDVWAFTHGKRTTIFIFSPDRSYSIHEAIPSNTSWRLFGLVLDVAVMATCVGLLLSKI